ncbi:hypothetical protein [Limimaricola cinnabarinus]|uniref:hypothetical protein n=1 Tax=Limimaricola cinnabarinus TaxID=1125964 RepID=UPI002491B3C3|nr:hypothetical protein [Limimaricola cinnabarinus]
MADKLEALRGLLAKVEAGTLFDPRLQYVPRTTIDMISSAVGADHWESVEAAYLMGSMNAAQSLHEALLPKGQWPGDRWMIWQSGEDFGCSIVDGIDTTYAPTRSRAWLAAILMALIAQEDAP